MTAKTRVTVLVENTAGGPDVVAEHGLSYWIEHKGYHVLFDSGQGGVLAHNAYKLAVPLREVDALVLSHGHYDHSGGVPEALKFADSAMVHAHPAAFARKFARNSDGTAREIGMPLASRETIRRRRGKFAATDRPTCVLEGVIATGPVPSHTDFEDVGGSFFLDEACTAPDSLEDDQAVFFDTAEGIIVLLGCAHAGVVNTVRYIQKLTENRPIHALIGGMHLVGASSRRIARTIEELKQIGVKRLAPAHCTGLPATVALCNAFPQQ